MICGLVVEKAVNFNLQYINYRSPTPIPTSDTATSNTTTIYLYLSADAPHSDKSPPPPTIIVCIANGHIKNLRLHVGLYPPTFLISCARVSYYPTPTTHWLGLPPFVTLIARSYSPKRLSLSMTLPEISSSRGGRNSMVRDCGYYWYALR